MTKPEQSLLEVQVDPEDEFWLKFYRWKINRSGYVVTSYYVRGEWLEPGRGLKNACLSRAIMDAPPGLEVDHINGDPLDNRKSNLRLVTHAQNCQNRRLYKNNTSGTRGVRREGNRWVAECREFGVYHRIGRFDTKEEAVKAITEWRAKRSVFTLPEEQQGKAN